MENLTSIDGNGKTPKLKKICSQKLIDWSFWIQFTLRTRKSQDQPWSQTQEVSTLVEFPCNSKNHTTHICVCQKNPNVVVGTPPKLLKFFPKTSDEQHPWLNFSLPTNPKTLQQERKKERKMFRGGGGFG
jgi:hypothetical protein